MLPTINLGINEEEKMLKVARALASPQRLDIVKALNIRSMNIKELSEYLKYPLSTTSLNVEILEECGIVKSELQFSSQGKAKVCGRNVDGIFFDMFHRPTQILSNQLVISIPIGNYSSYNVKPTCGLITLNHPIGQDNDEDNFFDPEHFNACLIWFSSGYLEYRVSKKGIAGELKSLEISFEACSEAPFYRNDYKSDITLWVNDIEVGTWLCPGDFGGRPGIHNPSWWPLTMTQYGILTNWTITEDGSYFGEKRISPTTLKNLNLYNDFISVKIGVKKDAHNKGGINLFGSKFGDYNQDIIVKATW